EVKGKNRLILPVEFLTQQIRHRVDEWYEWAPHRKDFLAPFVIAQANVLAETGQICRVGTHHDDSPFVDQITSSGNKKETQVPEEDRVPRQGALPNVGNQKSKRRQGEDDNGQHLRSRTEVRAVHNGGTDRENSPTER